MNDTLEPKTKGKRLGVKLALVGAGVAVGAITATTVGANATSTPTAPISSASTSSASTSSASTSSTPTRPNPGHGHGSRPVRRDEKSVGSATAAKLKAAALRAVSGGTVYRVETDSGDATYEAHMTKADGTEVTVKFDKNLAVTGVEAGMGK